MTEYEKRIEKIRQIEDAKRTLEAAGFYVSNLWHIDDIKFKAEDRGIKLAEEECQEILDSVLTNEWIVEQLQVSIDQELDLRE